MVGIWKPTGSDLENPALSWPPLPKIAPEMPDRTAKGDILTIGEVAAYLKVTQRTIYRLAAAKKVPAFKVGGTWRFSQAAIESWIKQQSADDAELMGNDTNRPGALGTTDKKTGSN